MILLTKILIKFTLFHVTFLSVLVIFSNYSFIFIKLNTLYYHIQHIQFNYFIDKKTSFLNLLRKKNFLTILKSNYIYVDLKNFSMYSHVKKLNYYLVNFF